MLDRIWHLILSLIVALLSLLGPRLWPNLPPLPTPTPTPRPLTFAEMNKLYGPCVYLPTFLYHHIQDMDLAKDKKQTSITVATAVFKAQMSNLKAKGYNTATMGDLTGFFDTGAAIPKKSVLLTFDDGYEDFYFNAYPVISQLGLRATVFLPTGLVGNPDYLSWGQVSEMAGSGLVYFANHTWSHKSVGASPGVVEREISLADTQLTERGLNPLKVFAYPYGSDNSFAINFLGKLGYKLAFTTKPGSALCKQQRLDLPRIRVGNGSQIPPTP